MGQIDKLGGKYSETTAIRHLLDYHGVTAAHSKKPISEARLFGISGGIGFSYYLFEYDGYEPTLFISVAHRYTSRFGQYMDRLYKRLGLETIIKMTRSSHEAETNLINDLAHGRPVIVHVDRGQLPYYAEETEYGDHALLVLGRDEKSNNLLIADQSQQPVYLPPADLSFARESIDSLSFRALTLTKPENPIDLEDGITRGIKQCWDALINAPQPKKNYGLSGLQNWVDVINSPKAKRGWLKIFTPGPNLYVGLKWTFKCIETLETGGGGMRGLYADFLEEAAPILDNKNLKDVAKLYRKSAKLWTELAYAALPDAVPLLKDTREMIINAEEAFLKGGMKAVDEMVNVKALQDELTEQAYTNFPLDATQSTKLLDGLKKQLEKILDIETEAATALKEAMIL
jgi:hypothetical protein